MPSVDFDPPTHMPHRSDEVREVMIEYLVARKQSGFDFVNSKDIRRGLQWDPTPQKIGVNIRELRNKGYLDKWSGGSPVTYKITVTEMGLPTGSVRDRVQ